MPDQTLQVSYTWVAKPLPEAAHTAGVSLTTLREAIDNGDLIAHYVGARRTKPIVRALDLDEWIRNLPTESRGR